MDQQRGAEESTANGGSSASGSSGSGSSASGSSASVDQRQLSPEARASSRWIASLRKAKLPLLAAAVVLIGGGLIGRHFLADRQPTCREIWDKDLGYDLAVITCQREYDRTKDPRTGVILANSLYRTRNKAAAKDVANGLLNSVARPDALLLIGKIAVRDNQYAEALSAFDQAEKIYMAAGNQAQTAKTLLARSQVLDDEQRVVEALEDLERCSHLARQAGDNSLEASCHAGAAFIFMDMGAEELAGIQLDLARKLDAETYESDALSLVADMLQESSGEQHRQAIARFEAALVALERSKNKARTAGIHLNLAFSFASIDRITDAEDQLERAKISGSEDGLLASTLSVAGFIEMKKGNFATADSLLSRAIELSIKQDDWSDVREAANDRAHMALKSGDLAAAGIHASQAVDAVETLLSRHKVPLYRSWLTARYRRSYELLFVALARQGRGEQALAVVDRWMSRGAIDSVTPSPPVTDQIGEVIPSTRSLTKAYISLQGSAVASASSADELHQQLRGADLIVLVAAEGELWRVSSHDGAVTVSSLGQYAALFRDLFDRFKAEPFDTEAASAVGAMFIPPEMAAVRDRPLQLVLDERMTTLPVEAMRLGGKLVLEQRPIVRALRPSMGGCAPQRTSSPRATVVADAIGDLPGALTAAKSVAERFKVPAFTGPEAKRAYLSTPADLLHIGVHGNVDKSGSGLLSLADGDESAVDIAGRGSSPKIVFLAACKSALAEHGSYSLATSFLVAGADQVVAALHYVDDALAARVTTEFYKNGGDRDPAAALAASLSTIAAERAHNAAVEWPRFAVFGHATCKVGDVPRGK